MNAVTVFDWRNPDYGPVWRKRLERLAKIRSSPEHLLASKIYYKDHIADFIEDWGVTVDPRNAGTNRPVIMPFVLFPKQREFVDFVMAQWRAEENGILVKSRDCGASWLAIGISVALCLFWGDGSIGFGSRKEELVDASGNPDSLFYKGRMFTRYLPREFKGEWDDRKNSKHMQLLFPNTGSSVTGEAGDNIGRGGRKSIYFVDEFAYIERPQKVDAALSANTKCRIEMSSVNGLANTFAERARGGLIKRFDFSYLDDPRKVNQETKQPYPDFAEFLSKLDPVVVAAEYGCDFLASVEGAVIEAAWIQAAIGAAQRLGITVTGEIRGAFDIADTGKDKNAMCVAKGIEVLEVEDWSGTGSNPMTSVRRAFEIADRFGLEDVDFDGDGMGASWRDYFGIVNFEREKKIRWVMFRGSGPVLDPEAKTPGTDRKNIDYLENQKAQSWMALRRRFYETFRAVNGEKYDPSGIISLNPKMKRLTALVSELGQPTRTWSKTGKLMIDKVPDGVMSPNLGDSVMMRYRYARPNWVFPEELFSTI